MIRLIDFSVALLFLIIGFPLLALIVIIGFFDTKAPIFFQQRVGLDKRPFTLIKFRTMTVDTESVPSHLASRSSITTFGQFLRKTKLDELPQLWNVLKGEMSLVGPRPNLCDQYELIEARDAKGVYSVRPGITGLAQIQNIDMSTPELLAETDAMMIANLSLPTYAIYVFKTVLGSGFGDVIK